MVRKQNAIVSAGTIETKSERLAMRVDGAPTSAEQLALPFSAGGALTLGDVADIKRLHRPPPVLDALQLRRCSASRVMQPGGNVQQLGKARADDGRHPATAGRHHRHRVANQPEADDRSMTARRGRGGTCAGVFLAQLAPAHRRVLPWAEAHRRQAMLTSIKRLSRRADHRSYLLVDDATIVVDTIS